MRWLLLKDLQILKRSPLRGRAARRLPDRARRPDRIRAVGRRLEAEVAFLNEATDATTEQLNLGVGDDEFGSSDARGELCQRVDCIDVDSREEAEQMVQDGDVLGALILPADLLDKLRSLTGLNPEQPTVEVLVNEDDPVKASLVDDRIKSLVTEANLILSKKVSQQAATYLDLLVKGGHFSVPLLGQDFDILGLEKTQAILDTVGKSLPKGSAEAELLAQVERFAKLAGDNLDDALPLLGAVGRADQGRQAGRLGRHPQPQHLRDRGRRHGDPDVRHACSWWPGSLALEREENAFARITRGLGRPHGPARREGRPRGRSRRWR